MISCKEAVSRLWTYLDRNLGRVQEHELEEHLGLCRHCCGELEFARQIRERLRATAAGSEIPPQTRERLETFVRRLGDGGA
ncbi:MAG: zf-HC2 domain-containing protein [Armatimonadota bacterium]|nr:zf-HC2 domain-containing protein [Armatimonadota bacterium]MDR7450733.1 zf-HC2 domain-containing protein [Armatimonadota bacterium]MDR7466089.1 zf-HC2 domain-containing protein [Armatimonadota bacterium]MDR7493874.1 zf-HC2 domain-containing protein [Armatimonadota bacterium]MDR7498965.1 zf-HC2 domain-containing protein [Armatimonadota bacterium]